MLERDGTTGENESVEEDVNPHVEVEEPGAGISHVATSEEEKFLTSPPPAPCITQEATTVGCSARHPSTQGRRQSQ